MVILCKWNTPIVFRHTYRSWTNLTEWNPPTLGIWQRKPLYSRCKHSHPLVLWALFEDIQDSKTTFRTLRVLSRRTPCKCAQEGTSVVNGWLGLCSDHFGSLNPPFVWEYHYYREKVISMEEGCKIEVINKEIAKWGRTWNIAKLLYSSG